MYVISHSLFISFVLCLVRNQNNMSTFSVYLFSRFHRDLVNEWGYQLYQPAIMIEKKPVILIIKTKCFIAAWPVSLLQSQYNERERVIIPMLYARTVYERDLYKPRQQR